MWILPLAILAGCAGEIALDSAGQDGVPASSSGAVPADAVTIGNVVFAAETARTPRERTRGLSARDSLPPSTGMLFVFPGGHALTLWMKGMRFALDFIWIGENCEVVDVLTNVPPAAPNAPDSKIPRYRAREAAVYIFEVNGGEVGRYGIEVGDRVRFTGFALEVTGSCP